jgi:hypothetical protein
VAQSQEGLVPVLCLDRLLASQEVGAALDAARAAAGAPAAQGVAP